MNRQIPLWIWALMGAMLIATTQVAYCLQHGRSVLALLQVGEDSPTKVLLEQDFGPFPQGFQLGHDGKYFYLIARHPAFWNASPEVLHGLQDPGYRYARPLYPLLAGCGGLLSPGATLGGLILVQVFCGGSLALVLVLIARRQNLSLWFVVLAMANPALYSSAVLLTSDLLALTLGLAGVLAWTLSRYIEAIVLFALSILAKEYYVIIPFSLAFTALMAKDAKRFLVFSTVPAIPWIMWKMALVNRLGSDSGDANFRMPLVGYIDAATRWDTPGWCLAVLATVVVLMAVVLVLKKRDTFTWLSLPWVVLAGVASELVWNDPADLLRVIAPLWVFVQAKLFTLTPR